MPRPQRPALDIDLSDSQGILRLDPDRLRSIARFVLLEQGVSGGSLSIALVDDPTIHEINRRHLDHDWPTDVISFPLSDPGDPEFSGELVISAETARRVASQCDLDPGTEIALYLIHGLLHLCGYDDRDDPERTRMRRREDELLDALNIPRPPRDVEECRNPSPGPEARP